MADRARRRRRLIDADGIFRNTALEHWRRRRFVARQHSRDMADQRKLALESLPQDWKRLAAEPVTPLAERWIRMLWLQGEAAVPAARRAREPKLARPNPGWTVEVRDAAPLHRW